MREVLDIQASRQAPPESRLEYRRAMEERLLRILQGFMVSEDRLEGAVDAALAECVQFSGASMGYVIRVAADGQSFSMTNMWSGGPVPRDALRVRDIPIELFPEETRAGRLLRVDDVNAIPDGLPYKASFQEHGVGALLDVPMRSGDELLGAVGLSFLGARHVWSEEEELLLRFLAAALGHGLQRIEAAERRARLEEQLRQAQRMEVAARTAGGVAHDFRNMITVVLTCADLALDPAISPAGRDELVREIRTAGVRAADLAARLTRLGGEEHTVLAPVDVTALLSGLAPTIRRLLPSGIRLEVTSNSDEPLVVAGDAVALEQAMLNLCLNARDSMPEGGALRVGAAAEVTTETGLVHGLPSRAGPHVVVTVADTGTGIAEGSLSRIFEPFYTTKAPGQGTGLGLATVYATCKRLGGWVDVRTARGEGSTFRMYLPVGSATAFDPWQR